MKKAIFLATIVGLSLAALPVLADHDDNWHRKHDPDHCNQWKYDQFRAWHKKHHHCDETESRARYDEYNRDRAAFWRKEYPH